MYSCVCVCLNINLLGPSLLFVLRRNLVLQVILVVQNAALPFSHRLFLAHPDLIGHLMQSSVINNTENKSIARCASLPD